MTIMEEEFTCSGIANNEDRMSNIEDLFQLNNLQHEVILCSWTRFFCLQMEIDRCFSHFAFEFLISEGANIQRLSSNSVRFHLFRSTSRAGNRSPIRFRKIGMSSAVIFGMLKSRNARISTLSSLISGSARRSVPATTSTDLIARRPQS